MNKLPLEKRAKILNMLVEGEIRMQFQWKSGSGISINTVSQTAGKTGTQKRFHDKTVHGLKTAQLQCDEIWSFCYAKKVNAPNIEVSYRGSLATSGRSQRWTAPPR